MIKVKPMELRHLEQVYEIERDSFSIPWTKEDIRREIVENKLAICIVAVEDDSTGIESVFGYAGLWHVVTEGHITNIAVKSEHRRKGIGDLLVEEMKRIAREKEMLGLTLEVRIGNYAAQKLYTKHGFKPEGFRKNYYSDTKEDAIIMWCYF